MNENAASYVWVNHIGRGMTELLFYMPLFLTLGVYLFPSGLAVPWLMSLLIPYMAGALTADRWPRTRIIVRWLVSLGIASVHTAAVGIIGEGLSHSFYGIVSLICGLLVAERGAAMIRNGWQHSFNSAYMAVGIMIYVVIVPLSYLLLHELAAIRFWVIACGMAALILGLNIVNDRHLTGESVDQSKSQTLLTAKKRNRLLLAGLTLLILFFSAFRHIQQWVENNLREGLSRLLSLFDRGESTEAPPEPPAEQPPNMLPPMEAAEPSPFLVWLEQVMRIVVTIAIVIAAVFVLYWLGKKFAALMRKWMDKLLRRQLVMAKEDGAYTDETESLMTLNKWREKYRDKLKLRKRSGGEREPAWEELSSGKERMRWLYRQWLKAEIRKGFVPQLHLTPRETADTLADWNGKDGHPSNVTDFVRDYEAARYGGADPVSERLDQHRSWVDKQGDSKRGWAERRRK
ncbi:DUF4129 domain-containing protein [Paenibacillus sp. LHD-117]|uniref:DUF4129 domain-containing protein n=1 Tax=Paenibacillus sp. LHD-117 TaxID=3071412 RepID=UPI0027E02D9B|nr:DUF4129 domain-containing protein [Paenibacillus sp. LHD-117]MDQ6418050.1 DUF4129 domain-containing protein [Paenibacillus sp. LHD-117]